MSLPGKENKMGVMPIPRLLFSMAIPMIISMLVQAFYNIVDSVFVAQLPNSSAALTAVSLAFPVQNLMIAVGAGTGVGINALLSRSLGEKNTEQASKAANNGVFLALMSYLAFLLFGLLGAGAYMSSQTADPQTLSYGTDYLSLCCMLSFGLFGQFVFERLLQSTGKTLFTMVTQGLGAIINIFLDPIFIFGLFGFPRMEVAGAAVATVTGQVIAMGLAILFNVFKNREIHLSFLRFRPSGQTIKRIYAVGVPSIVMGSIVSVMTFCLNLILNALNPTGVTVLGVYFKLQSFVFMPVFGLNNGMIPIVAYNYGARHRTRIMHTMRLSILCAVSMMLIGLAVFQLFPQALLGMFNADAQMLAVGVPALRIISLSFLFAGFCIIVGSMFQALSHGFLSLIVSVGRQLVVLVPAAFLLSLSGNIDMVWWAFPIAEIMSLTLSVLFMLRVYRREIRPLED